VQPFRMARPLLNPPLCGDWNGQRHRRKIRQLVQAGTRRINYDCLALCTGEQEIFWRDTKLPDTGVFQGLAKDVFRNGLGAGFDRLVFTLFQNDLARAVTTDVTNVFNGHLDVAVALCGVVPRFGVLAILTRGERLSNGRNEFLTRLPFNSGELGELGSEYCQVTGKRITPIDIEQERMTGEFA